MIFRGLVRLAPYLVLVLALARLVHSGVVFPWHSYEGDFFVTFPPPYVERTNPVLFEQLSPYYKGDLYVYGPAQYLATHPLTYLEDPLTIARILLVVQLAMLLAIAVVLYRRFWGRVTPWRLATYVLIWTAFVPLYEVLAQRNIEVLEFTLMVAAFLLTADAARGAAADHRARSWLAGLAVGLATLCKVKPVGLLLYFVARRNSTAAAAMLLTIAIGLTATNLFVGLDRFWIYREIGLAAIVADFDDGASAVARGVVFECTECYTTLGLREAIERTFATYEFDLPDGAGATRVVTASWAGFPLVGAATVPRVMHSPSPLPLAVYLVVTLGFLGLLFHLLWRLRDLDEPALVFALVITGATVLSPHGEFYYLLFLLYPFSYLAAHVWRSFEHASREEPPDRVSAWGGGLAWLLVGGGVLPWGVYDWLLGAHFGYGLQPAYLLMNIPTCGGLLLLCVLMRVAWRRGASADAGRMKAAERVEAAF